VKRGDDSLGLEPADQAWFDALRAEPGPGAAPEDAVLLARALVSEQARAEQAADALGDGEHQLQRLMFELRRAAPEPAATHAPAGRAGGWGRRGGWALAAMLVLAVAVALLRPQDAAYDEPPEWRGAIPERSIRVEAPRAHAEALVAQLRAAGLGVALYQDGAVLVLDVSVPAERLEAMRGTLEGAGLQPVAGMQRLRVEP
jgi:hypothetical protein